MSAFQGYASLARLVGPWYMAMLVLARLPVAMTIFGTITYVTVERASVADAGLVAGVLAICTAIGQPLHGRWTQSAGQRLPMMILAPVCAASLLGSVWAGRVDAPLWVFVALAAVTGATQLPVGGLSRVRWGAVVRDKREHDTSISLESVTEESTFVLGPALVGVLAAAVGAWAPLVVSALGLLTLVPAFALHPLSPGPAGHEVDAPRLSMARALGHVWAPVLALSMVGAYFGSVQTAVAAVTQHLGNPGAGGMIYALMGIGSATTALATVALPERLRLSTRAVVAAILMAASVALSLGSDRGEPAPMFALLAAMMVLGGCGVGVAIVSLYGLIVAQAPARALPVALTGAGAATVAGVSVGAAITGRVSEGVGPAAGFAPAILACLVLALAAVRAGRATTRVSAQDPAA